MSALVAAVLVLPVRGALSHLFHPASPEDVRSLADSFAKEHRPGEAIYVFGRSVPSWVFYTTDWKSPDLDRVGRLSELVASEGPAFRNAPSRGRPIAAEGDDLVYPNRDFSELVGIPPGTGPTLKSPGGADAPDPGWAENEVGRIRRAAGNGRVWVLLSSFKPAVGAQLVQALDAGGARLESRRETDAAMLLRYRFPQ
jgi:hypothetical protein